MNLQYFFEGRKSGLADRVARCYDPTTKGEICVFFNPHSFAVALDDSRFKRICENSELFCDGVGLYLVEAFLNGKHVTRVPGLRFVRELLAQAQEQEIKLMFVGSSDTTLLSLKQRLNSTHDVEVFAPPFKETFDQTDILDIARAVNRAEPDILLLGLTAPKQEKLASQLASIIDVRSILCVGAVFDYLAGTSKPPPNIVSYVGMEWLWRLCHAPRKMYKRTLISFPIFLGFHIRRYFHRLALHLYYLLVAGLNVVRAVKAVFTRSDLALFYLKGSFWRRCPSGINDGILWEIGGHEGFFTCLLAIRNPASSIISFEPVPRSYTLLKQRTRLLENVEAKPYGLANRTGKLQMNIEDDASRGSQTEADTDDFFDIVDTAKSYVDFVSMNIEGGEYPLLNRLAEQDKVRLFGVLQIQFHFYEDRHFDDYDRAQTILWRTHYRKWIVKDVWEEWHLLP